MGERSHGFPFHFIGPGIALHASRSQIYELALESHQTVQMAVQSFFNAVLPMITPTASSHFRPISSQDFANWLRSNVPNRLWSVDGEETLSAQLDFPCSTEELAATFHKINQVLQIQVPDFIEGLSKMMLNSAILHFPVSPGNPDQFISFSLYWEGQGPEDAWVLSEDLPEDS